jgi:hypothetical protein
MLGLFFARFCQFESAAGFVGIIRGDAGMPSFSESAARKVQGAFSSGAFSAPSRKKHGGEKAVGIAFPPLFRERSSTK